MVTGAKQATERGAGLVVCKLGGRALEAPGALPRFASECAALARPMVLVHGGGAEVSAWCARFGIEPRFADGLRVTDAETLEVAAAVLCGLANKRLVAALRSAGIDAVGVAGIDGGTLALELHPNAAVLGEVGEVRDVDPRFLEELLAAGRTPVLSSLGAIADRLLNVNADDVAGAIAAAVGADVLVLLSDATALRLDGAPVRTLRAAELEPALAHPDVQDGMRPKLRAARTALAGGVPRVVIGAYGERGLAPLLAGEEGTLVSATEATHV